MADDKEKKIDLKDYKIGRDAEKKANESMNETQDPTIKKAIQDLGIRDNRDENSSESTKE